MQHWNNFHMRNAFDEPQAWGDQHSGSEHHWKGWNPSGVDQRTFASQMGVGASQPLLLNKRITPEELYKRI